MHYQSRSELRFTDRPQVERCNHEQSRREEAKHGSPKTGRHLDTTLITSLPILETCAGCGACCEHITVPPFTTAAFWNLPKHLRNDLIRFRQENPSLHGTPCRWLDPKTKVCRHYEWRPVSCRDFQFSGLDCLRLRHGRRPSWKLTAAERAIAKAGLFKQVGKYANEIRLCDEVYSELEKELQVSGVEFEDLSFAVVEAAEIRALGEVAARLLAAMGDEPILPQSLIAWGPGRPTEER